MLISAETEFVSPISPLSKPSSRGTIAQATTENMTTMQKGTSIESATDRREVKVVRENSFSHRTLVTRKSGRSGRAKRPITWV